MKTVEEVVSQPYHIIIRRDDEASHDAWFAHVEELPGCITEGRTAEHALEMIREAMELWVEVALELGDPIPPPRDDALPSGRILARVPATLHRALLDGAAHEGVSLNLYVTSILAGAVGMPAREGP